MGDFLGLLSFLGLVAAGFLGDFLGLLAAGFLAALAGDFFLAGALGFFCRDHQTARHSHLHQYTSSYAKESDGRRVFRPTAAGAGAGSAAGASTGFSSFLGAAFFALGAMVLTVTQDHSN